MAANKPSKEAILAAFFDEGNYSPLFTDGAVSAAFGCANGQSVYAVYQNGEPVGAADLDKTTRVLKMAAETGNPVVTFYNSTGAKLEGGLELLNANSRLTAEIARISGVVPQVAVVTGTCAGTSAVQAAAADVCIMAADAELFLTAPFNAEDKVKAAGSADPKAVNEALWGVKYDGVTGHIEFNETGDAKRDAAYVKTANTETGAWDFVAVQKVESDEQAEG